MKNCVQNFVQFNYNFNMLPSKSFSTWPPPFIYRLSVTSSSSSSSFSLHLSCLMIIQLEIVRNERSGTATIDSRSLLQPLGAPRLGVSRIRTLCSFHCSVDSKSKLKFNRNCSSISAHNYSKPYICNIKCLSFNQSDNLVELCATFRDFHQLAGIAFSNLATEFQS